MKKIINNTGLDLKVQFKGIGYSVDANSSIIEKDEVAEFLKFTFSFLIVEDIDTVIPTIIEEVKDDVIEIVAEQTESNETDTVEPLEDTPVTEVEVVKEVKKSKKSTKKAK